MKQIADLLSPDNIQKLLHQFDDSVTELRKFDALLTQLGTNAKLTTQELSQLNTTAQNANLASVSIQNMAEATASISAEIDRLTTSIHMLSAQFDTSDNEIGNFVSSLQTFSTSLKSLAEQFTVPISLENNLPKTDFLKNIDLETFNEQLNTMLGNLSRYEQVLKAYNSANTVTEKSITKILESANTSKTKNMDISNPLLNGLNILKANSSLGQHMTLS